MIGIIIGNCTAPGACWYGRTVTGLVGGTAGGLLTEVNLEGLDKLVETRCPPCGGGCVGEEAAGGRVFDESDRGELRAFAAAAVVIVGDDAGLWETLLRKGDVNPEKIDFRPPPSLSRDVGVFVVGGPICFPLLRGDDRPLSVDRLVSASKHGLHTLTSFFTSTDGIRYFFRLQSPHTFEPLRNRKKGQRGEEGSEKKAIEKC